LVIVDAAGLTTRELNGRLKELAASGQEITVLNPHAGHNIAVGIFESCRIQITGSVGYYAASLLDGPEVAIDGNAGWALGENMMQDHTDQRCRSLGRLDHARRRVVRGR